MSRRRIYPRRKKQNGYSGNVFLISPSGEIRELHVPGRQRLWGWEESKELSLREDYGVRSKSRRQNKTFSRLLSAGWRVLTSEELKKLENDNGEWKKGTDIVIGTTKTGDKSHGGSHNSGEVLHQSERPRGNRGGRKFDPAKREKRRGKRLKPVEAQATGVGRNPVFSKQPLRISPDLLESAEESGCLLSKLVGQRSPIKIERGVRIDVEKLLIALEIDDDPLPALEAPDERPRMKVLVTPDSSGSCQNWSGLGRAWALHLSSLPDIDIIYVENSNGEFWEVDEEEVQKMVEGVDVVIYLGDGDGYEICTSYAQQGATVVALDNFCASDESPRLRESKRVEKGHLYWVDKVSAKAPYTWANAIELCLK